MTVLQQRLRAFEVVARGTARLVVAQLGGAPLERRKVVCRPVVRGRAAGALFALGDEEHHADDHGATDDVDDAHRRAQPHRRYDRGRHRLDAADETRAHRAGVGDALEVEQVGGERAHDDHGEHDPGKLGRNLDGDGPGLHGDGGHRAADEHGEARHDEAAPLLQHLAGKQRVERQRERRDDAPEQAFRRNGQRTEVALRGDEDGAADGEHEAGGLADARQAPHAQAHVHHDDDEAEALQHGAGARVRVGDGRQVAHLGQKHAQQGERCDAPERAHVAQSGQQVARLPHAAHHEEDDRGQQQAHAGDPGNGNAETAGHELSARAREAPADAAESREYDAADHVVARCGGTAALPGARCDRLTHVSSSHRSCASRGSKPLGRRHVASAHCRMYGQRGKDVLQEFCPSFGQASKTPCQGVNTPSVNATFSRSPRDVSHARTRL